MTLRRSSAVFALALSFVLTIWFAVFRPPVANANPGCPSPTASVSNGQALFEGANCPNCTTICTSCHGVVSEPCDLTDPVCYPCRHPDAPDDLTKGVNIATYGTRPGVFEPFANGTFAMGDMTEQETMQLFQDLGITTQADFADVAAYLASVDPRRYKIKGTLFTQGLGGSPIDVQACSDISASATASIFSVSQIDPHVLFYEIWNLPSGRYKVSPVPYGSEPPVRNVINSIFPGIQGCLYPDCTLPPVCSTDMQPVDFHVSADIYCDPSLGGDVNDGKSWRTAKKSMREAMDAARPGDEIWVAAGTFTETITLKPGVALYGGFAGHENFREERNPEIHRTILDGKQKGSVITMTAGGRVDGFTIQRGRSSVGGGIQILFCGDGPPPVIANNAITDNRADSGGGIGVACGRFGAVAPIIVNNVITNNRADGNGGGIFVGAGGPAILNNRILQNRAVAGGGIYAADGLIANNAILENRSDAGGGGIHTNSSGVQIINNTLVGNDASRGHGGAIELADPPAIVASNIIAFGSSGVRVVAPSRVSTLRNNCLFGNRGLDYSGVPPGEGDIHVDPQFVDIRGRALDIRLRPSSPCIDAGDDSAVRAGWADIDGDPRTLRAHVDIGADESHSTRRVTLRARVGGD